MNVVERLYKVFKKLQLAQLTDSCNGLKSLPVYLGTLFRENHFTPVILAIHNMGFFQNLKETILNVLWHVVLYRLL